MNRNSKRRTQFSLLMSPGRIAFVVAMGAAPLTASAQLRIDEVCTVASTACVGPGSKPAIRRGMTETIKIRGPFVNHTDMGGVSTGNPAVTISRVIGTACGTVGCLDMTITVRPDFNLGARLVPIFVRNIFGSTAFNAFVVRKGEITGMTQDPVDPIWGQRVAVRITGNDIGNTRAAVSQSGVYNHVEAGSGSGAGVTTFDVVAAGSPTHTTTSVTLGDDDVSGIPGNYRFTIPRRTVNYRAATTTASCVTTPNIGAPSPTSPANGQVFTFTNDPVQASITLGWGGSYQGQFKPTEEYRLEIGPVTGAATAYSTGPGIMTKSLSLARNRRYHWRVKAYNCGMTAPFSAYAEFNVQ